jgi:lysophospholipase L1-like esterase
MSIKPNITLLFLLSVFTVLLLLSLFFPSDGMRLAGNFSLKFITPEEIFSPAGEDYADISDIIDAEALLNDSLLAELSAEEIETSADTVRANADSLRRSITRLRFAEGNRRLLYPVFAALDNASRGSKPVRIMHYGDSQIEGDRITSFLRNQWQKKFGGMGVGMIPVQQVYDFKFSIDQETSSNWYRYTLYGNRDSTLTHRRYGALASFARFSPPEALLSGNDQDYEAWVSFKTSVYSYRNTKQFQQCRIFYGHNSQPFLTEIYLNGELAEAEMYPASSQLKTLRWIFDEPVSDLKIVFRGSDSPDIYGIALDGKAGVAVDNIAMRGNSGLIFDRMDATLLREHYKVLNTKLILLEFGGNVVPHITSDYGYYERLFRAQLKQLKKIVPDAVVIVIGVADMSIKEKNRYVSYPNVEKVRDALKNATLSSGAIYWDMYEAMGGKNSMPSWVFANPPLASSDFVHFNPRGAKIIANMFYNAFMYEYNLYKKEQSKEVTEKENKTAGNDEKSIL